MFHRLLYLCALWNLCSTLSWSRSIVFSSGTPSSNMFACTPSRRNKVSCMCDDQKNVIKHKNDIYTVEKKSRLKQRVSYKTRTHTSANCVWEDFFSYCDSVSFHNYHVFNFIIILYFYYKYYTKCSWKPGRNISSELPKCVTA